ncbi:MAG: COX15/CtaA family protein [Planctomycetes bacterium]|nr:COX15/CtaA family protein [Planctomycetota bacterium]
MNADTNQTANIIHAALTLGFLSSVLMWCAWFLTHLPGHHAPAAVTGVLLLVVMSAVLARAGLATSHRPWLVGLLAGLTCGLVNLLLLGSVLVEQPTSTANLSPGTSGIRPDAVILVPGFLLLCSVLGAIAAAAGSRLARTGRDDPQRDWVAAFAWVAVIATIPVLLIGGIVTSADAGLAVPDWPGSYGANMFLYPLALMADPRIFLEHTHRLFGSLIGLTTLVLCLQALFSRRTMLIKGWAIGLLVLVIVQGIMGGLRIVEQNPYFGALHGVTAQVFFALVVAFAAVLASKKADPNQPPFGRAGPMTAIWLGCVLLQLVFGAMYRHLSASDQELAGVGHILMSHIGFSFVVLILAVVTGSMLRGKSGENESIPQARIRVGKSMIHVVGLQFILGWAAFFFSRNRGTPPTADELSAEQVPLVETLVTMAHQLNGAFVLALATLAFGMWIVSRRAGQRG